MNEITTKEDVIMLTDKQKEVIVLQFDKPNTTLELKFLINELRKEYQQPDRVVRDALLEGLLYVDSIDDAVDGAYYIRLALTDSGEDIWGDLNE